MSTPNSLILSINQIAYGQPTIEQRIMIDQGTMFEKHLEVFKNEPYPQNGSPEAKQECYDVVTKIERLSDSEWRNRCFFIDKQLGKYLNGYAQKAGLNGFKDIWEQVNELYLEALFYDLKYHYNRIRPQQLAYFLNVKMTPATTRTGHTPSYPSGHTLQTHFFTRLISDITETPWSDEPTKEVAMSRMSMGCHFKSDNDFAVKISDYLLGTEEYKQLLQAIKKELGHV